MKAIIVYHQQVKATADKPAIDCPDGVCSAWVVARYLDTLQVEYEVIGDSYLSKVEYESEGYQLPFDPMDRDVYVVDFIYPFKQLKAIAQKARSFTLLDHHDSNKSTIKRFFDLEQFSGKVIGGYSPIDCGATYAWKQFFPDRPEPWFLRHVWRRDTGAEGYYDGLTPQSEAVGIAMSGYRKGLVGVEAFPVFEQLLGQAEAEVVEAGMPQIEERDALVAEAIAQYNGATIDVGGYVIPYYQIANPKCHRHYYAVGSAACRSENCQYGFVAVVTSNPLAISLRGNSATCKVHLGWLAKWMGGGGHPMASGFEINSAHVFPEVKIFGKASNGERCEIICFKKGAVTDASFFRTVWEVVIPAIENSNQNLLIDIEVVED